MKLSIYRSFLLWLRTISFLLCMTPAFGLAIIEQSLDTWVASGEQATIYCEFDESVSSCSWNKNGIEVDVHNFQEHYQPFTSDNASSINICSLSISNISLEVDGGTWRCVVPRSIDFKGLISDPIHLIILVTPSHPEISGGLPGFKQLVANDKDQLRLTCSTQQGHPATNITWQLENFLYNGNLTATSYTRSLMTLTTTSELLVNVTLELHNVNIFCFAQHGRNVFNTSASFDIHYETTFVNLNIGTQIVAKVGEVLHVDCLSNGNPTPEFKWMMTRHDETNWRRIGNTSSLLLNVDESPPKRYKCYAGNKKLISSQEFIIIPEDVDSLDKLTSIVAAASCMSVVVLTAATVFFLYIRRRMSSIPSQTQNSIEDPVSLQDRPLPQKNEDDSYLVPRSFQAVSVPLPESHYVSADPMAIPDGSHYVSADLMAAPEESHYVSADPKPAPDGSQAQLALPVLQCKEYHTSDKQSVYENENDIYEIYEDGT